MADFNACAKPAWPEGAIAAQRTGTVTLSFLVGADGKLGQSKVVKSSGHPDLDEAARGDIQKCAFKPVASRLKMQYVWTLE